MSGIWCNTPRLKTKSNDSSSKGILSELACVIRTFLLLFNKLAAEKTASLGSIASIKLTLGDKYLLHLPEPHPTSRTIDSILIIESSTISKYSSPILLISSAVKSENFSHSSPKDPTVFRSILFDPLLKLKIVFSFTIPKDVDEGKYNLEIKVDSKDGNKARYSTEWVLELDIERENDDLRIENLAVTPSEISCSREATVSAKVANYGNDNQKYGVLTFTNSNLGLDQKFDFSLNSGNNKNNEIVKSQKFTVSDDLKPGIYSIIATTFYDYTTIADKNNVNLVVKECAIAKKSEPKIPNKTVTNEQPTAGTTDTNDKNTESDTKKITSSEIVKTQESTPYTLEDTFIALIIIAIIIITVMITLSIVLLFKK